MTQVARLGRSQRPDEGELDWQRHARCRVEGDPDWWFPEEKSPRKYAEAAQLALAVCRRCPVQALCLEYAVSQSTYTDSGIWGGLTPIQRDRIRHSRGMPVQPRNKGRM